MDGSRGRALDNTFLEHLWRLVKYEDVYLNGYADVHASECSLIRVFPILQHGVCAPVVGLENVGRSLFRAIIGGASFSYFFTYFSSLCRITGEVKFYHFQALKI